MKRGGEGLGNPCNLSSIFFIVESCITLHGCRRFCRTTYMFVFLCVFGLCVVCSTTVMT